MDRLLETARSSGRIRFDAEEVGHGTVTVLDEFRDGLMYAERHALDVTRRDGTMERAEISIIGRYAPDGRFQYIHEAGFRSRPAKPAELEGAEMTRLNDPDPAGTRRWPTRAASSTTRNPRGSSVTTKR
jgi:hypothetical protein